jgi:hypothetical protein
MLNFIGVCFVCKRRHDNIGFAASRNHSIKWNCWPCNEITMIAGKMVKKQFDAFETESMMNGGAIAGQYLDSINQTDLARLSESQFILFFAKFMGGYEESMRGAMQRLKETY